MTRSALCTAIFVAWCAGAGASSSAGEDRIRAAVIAAVHERMGAGTEVIVEALEIFNAPDDGRDAIDATPMPGAKLGGRVSFVLHGQGARGGRAVATLHVAAPHVEAARLIPRGKTIDAGDVTEQTSEVTGVPLRRLPTAADVIGARALHDVAAGALVGASAVAVPGAVRAGQTVRAVAMLGGVEVSASLVSMQNGQIGDVVRVVNRDSRRELKARVVGDAAVEVIQ